MKKLNEVRVKSGQYFQYRNISTSKTYRAWRTIKFVCDTPTFRGYDFVGGKGISYSERWKDFYNFYEDMGEIPKGKRIKRIDSTKDYSPENCEIK
jgi:hypothetical protein